MAVLSLPESVERKLRELAAGIRRMRVLRGTCWLALTLLSALLLALGADALFDLSTRTRTIIFTAWIAFAIAAAWWFVARRVYGRIPSEVLAQAVEANYPSLAERLQTLVELNENADPANGSRVMMAMLARDTERRTARLNFLTAAPRTYTLRLAIASAFASLLAVAPLLFLPGSGDRVRRLVQPWHTAPVEVAFRVVVSSGEPSVKRGESVTLAGYAERLKPGEAIPANASVVLREKGIEKTYPMRGDAKASFTFTKPIVNGDFEYSIAIGSLRSEWHRVSAVDPIQIAPGTTMRIRPPDYAGKNVPVIQRDGLGELEAFQFSTVQFDLKFQQPVRSAALEWRPNGLAANRPAESIAVALNPERTGASADFSIRTDGVLTWVLEGEKSIRTEIPLAVRAVRDVPPQFEKLAGFPAMAKEIRPGEPIAFEVAVRDDIAVASAVIEYGRLETIGSQLPFTEPLPIAGLGTPRAEGRLNFALANRFREGDRVVFRLRISDNRNVPAGNLVPQEITYPEKGWATLQISNAAKSLMEQEIQGQHAALQVRLAAIRAAVKEAADDLTNLRPEMLGRAKLAADQSVRLSNNRDRARQSSEALHELARAIDVVPDLRVIAETAKGIAERELHRAEELLRKTGQEIQPAARDAAAIEAQKELDAAVAKLDHLLKLNRGTGELRRDRGKLAQLAEEQKRLAENPAADAAKQQDLKDRLEKAVSESEFLRDANGGSERKERREFAKNLRDLHDALERLDARARDLEETDGKKRLEAVAAKQKELTERIAELAKKTEAATRLSNAPSLEKLPSENARDFIDQQKTTEALTEQEKAARELDRLAESLNRGANERTDGSKAAAQLERWQRDIRRRWDEAAKAHPEGVPDELRKKLKAEQESLGKSIAQLPLPATEELHKLRRESVERAAEAAKNLTDDPAASGGSLDKSAEALDRLSKRTPGNSQRNKAAAGELEKLRREHDAISREADEALRETAKTKPDELSKKRKDLAARQEALGKKLEQLDAPGEELRRDRTATQAKKAADDLASGSADDIPNSQRETKRQLDRLRDAIEGKPTPDRTAGELARLQRELSEKLERKPAVDELQRLQRDQREIQKQLSQLVAPEAEVALNEAREAVRNAEAELQKPMPDVDELRKKNESARDALDRLAEKLGNPTRNPASPKIPPDPANVLPNEADAKRASELAKQQRELREQLSRTVAGGSKAEANVERSNVEKNHRELAQEGKQLAERMGKPSNKSVELQKASDAAKQAVEKIEQAAQNQAKGKPAEAAANRRQALDSLKQAVDAVAVPGEGEPSGGASEGIAKAARDTRDAENAMNDALKQLQSGKPATDQMANAAKKLKQASEQLAPGKPSGPAEAANGPQQDGPDPMGPASSDVRPNALADNLGKRWGDLPGEVKAQITQELKAKYGEDYARIIKLYFEQLAERK